MSTNDINEADLGVSVLEMRESDIVPDLRLILDETTADVITVSAEIHPAFDPDSAADGEGALLVRFTDKEGRSRVAELEIKAKWLEDSCWHPRVVNGQAGQECADCGTTSAQDQPTVRCPSCACPVSDLVNLTGVHTASCTARVMCQCEHTDHENAPAGHRYLGVPAGQHRAHYVGPICDDCARGHLADYLLPNVADQWSR